MPKKKEDKKEDKGGGTLYVGIDFGTSRTCISASNGVRTFIDTVVGYPKDMIAAKFLGKEILFGEDALKNKLALTLYRPLEEGVIKTTPKDKEAARELIKYCMEIAKDKKEYDKIFAIIGAPAQTDHVNKQALQEVADGIVDATMVVSEPFTVAYSVDALNNSMIVDIGAGTVDLCRMHGTFPDESDELSSDLAGDYIDDQILDLVSKRYKGAQITKNQVQDWKEKYAFVGSAKEPVTVELHLDGKLNVCDITPEMGKACESIVPPIVDKVHQLIASFDPEFQEDLRQNIVVAGGGSQIAGLSEFMETLLDEKGGGRVTVADDPLYAGSEGALKLAQEMPAEYWTQL